MQLTQPPAAGQWPLPTFLGHFATCSTPSLPTAYCYKFSTLSGPIVHIHPELIGEPTMYYGLRVRKRDQADAGMFFCQS